QFSQLILPTVQAVDNLPSQLLHFSPHAFSHPFPASLYISLPHSFRSPPVRPTSHLSYSSLSQLHHISITHQRTHDWSRGSLPCINWMPPTVQPPSNVECNQHTPLQDPMQVHNASSHD